MEPITYEQVRSEIRLKIVTNALRKVLVLHNEQEITLPDGTWGSSCVSCEGFTYPCPTISVIQKAFT